MTLSYWWMHWFWITSHFIFVLSSDAVVTSHSISPDLNQMLSAGSNISGDPSSSTQQQQQHRAAKAFSGAQPIPPINDSPSNSTPATNGSNNNNVRNVSVVKFQKASGKKTPSEYPHHQPTTTTTNVTTNNTTTKVYFRSKDQSVINQNRSDINVSNSKQQPQQQQELVNISFVNSTEQEDNFSGIYANETTSFNQSLINSERIAERDDAAKDDASGNLSAAGITGITLGCVIVVGVICGVSYVLYRNRGFNRPQVLNDRCSNPDSSGYIDDASVRDNSEEMYSLDNDSFLNSLEAMTIQNYWTDTVKHTKL